MTVRIPDQRPIRPNLIGLIIPIMHFEFIGKVTAGILRAFDQLNIEKEISDRYRIVSACSQGECDREELLLRQLSEETDGLIVFPIHNHQVQAGKRDPRVYEAIV